MVFLQRLSNLSAFLSYQRLDSSCTIRRFFSSEPLHFTVSFASITLYLFLQSPISFLSTRSKISHKLLFLHLFATRCVSRGLIKPKNCCRLSKQSCLTSKNMS